MAVAGDMNCDGTFDGRDIEPFTLAVFDPVGYAAALPFCEINNGDVNGDMSVDDGDVANFVECLLNAGCP